MTPILGIMASQISGHLTPTTFGTVWNEYTLPATRNWTSTNGAGGKWVALCNTTNTAYSTNEGQTWTAGTCSIGDIGYAAYGNSTWVVAGYTGNTSCIMSSSDGINWTTRTATFSGNPSGMSYGAGVFVMTSYGNNQYCTSTDGITWTGRTLPTQTNARRFFSSYYLGYFCVTSIDSTYVDFSTDGISFTAGAALGSSTGSAAISGPVWILATNSTAYETHTNNSFNSTGRTSRTLPTTCLPYAFVASQVTNTFFILESSDPGTFGYTSPDGINWTSRTVGSSASRYRAPYSNMLGANGNTLMLANYNSNKINVSLL